MELLKNFSSVFIKHFFFYHEMSPLIDIIILCLACMQELLTKCATQSNEITLGCGHLGRLPGPRV